MVPRRMALIYSSAFTSAGFTFTVFSASTIPSYTFANIAKTALFCSFPSVEEKYCCDLTRHTMSTSKTTSQSIPDTEFCGSNTGYLSSKDASALDAELMTQPGGFALEQLMELAGLSVAEAVYNAYPPNSSTTKTSVVVVCGPGNNGGDGLVAARHLAHFGYNCSVVYPSLQKSVEKNQHYANLVQQCKGMNIPFQEAMPTENSADIFVDALFGFSFKGEPREPYASIIMNDFVLSKIPVVSVDVPSGWDVDHGDVLGTGFMPNVLVSLTTPKLSSKKFPGRHFIGRFLKWYLLIHFFLLQSFLSNFFIVASRPFHFLIQVVAFYRLYWHKNMALR